MPPTAKKFWADNNLITLLQQNRTSAIRSMLANLDRIEMTGKIFITDDMGWTSLHHASHLGRTQILELLLSKMTDRDALEAVSRKTWQLETCLHLACSSDHRTVDVVHFLLSKGADPNALSSDGCTPVHAACRKHGKIEVVKLLATMGGNLMKPGGVGGTPLELAFHSGDTDLMDYLLSCKLEREPLFLTVHTYALGRDKSRGSAVLKMVGSHRIRDLLSAYWQMFVPDYDPFLLLSPEHLVSLDPSQRAASLKLAFDQLVDKVLAGFCKDMGEADVHLQANESKKRDCYGRLLKYFPELDVRQKISLKAIARHSFRCAMNEKYNCWTAYQWLRNDFDFPALKSYLLYEDESTTFPRMTASNLWELLRDEFTYISKRDIVQIK